MDTRTALLLVWILGACSSNERLAVQPCVLLTELATRSIGFDPDDLDETSLDEQGSRYLPFDVVVWLDGDRQLFETAKLRATLSSYEGKLTQVIADARQGRPLKEAPIEIGPIVASLERAGFKVIAGDPAKFMSQDVAKRLRRLEYQKGDHIIHLSMELGITNDYRMRFATESAGACRSPAYNAWLAANPVPPDFYDD